MKRSQKRICEIKIRFLDDELEVLNEKVRKTGMSREAYCRKVLNGSEVKEGPSANVPLLLQELRKISIAIDGLVTPNNSLYGGREREQLAQVLDDLQQAEQQIVEAFSLRG